MVRELSVLEERCKIAEEARERSYQNLQVLLTSLKTLEERLAVEIEAAQKAHRYNEQALDNLRHELRIATDVTIPSLVSAHKLVLARYDAEVAIQVRRQVAATGVSDGPS